jgi:hypothetical protein
MLLVIMGSIRIHASQTGTCGGQSTTIPFDDVLPANVFFCSIAEAFFSGLTNGTSGTTYSPGDPVPRGQMAAFVTRTMDQSVKRGSKRAALNQYWTTQTANNLGETTVGASPQLVQSDGADLWVPNFDGNTISRVRGSDGKLLETWTGANFAFGVLCAMGKVFVTGQANPGKLYQIDPTQPGGPVTTLSSNLGPSPTGIGYDGQRIWTANFGPPGSVSIITLNPTAVATVITGFNHPDGVIYDGSNIWVTDEVSGTGKLHKLDSTGAILLTADVSSSAGLPAYDGTNIWVPSGSNTVSVVRAIGGFAGTVIATLSGNGLVTPHQAAFDGERILVTNRQANSVSLWKATDLTPIGTFSTGTDSTPYGVCSDGLNFWICLSNDPGYLARF